MIHLCRSMRWKAWYGHDVFTEAGLAALYAANEVPYGCIRTGQPWGPDDDVCAPESCAPGRSCFAPSPKLVRAEAPLA